MNLICRLIAAFGRWFDENGERGHAVRVKELQARFYTPPEKPLLPKPGVTTRSRGGISLEELAWNLRHPKPPRPTRDEVNARAIGWWPTPRIPKQESDWRKS